MTYKYNPTEHTAKIKAGLETAKKKGKKLGRPKSGKIKGEERVIEIYKDRANQLIEYNFVMTYSEIAEEVGVSKSTVQRIINKYRKNEDSRSNFK